MVTTVDNTATASVRSGCFFERCPTVKIAARAFNPIFRN
jgi:hypothetical protein